MLNIHFDDFVFEHISQLQNEIICILSFPKTLFFKIWTRILLSPENYFTIETKSNCKLFINTGSIQRSKRIIIRDFLILKKEIIFYCVNNLLIIFSIHTQFIMQPLLEYKPKIEIDLLLSSFPLDICNLISSFYGIYSRKLWLRDLFSK